MFQFNVKSDLKDGRLVTPISATENDTVICLDEDGNEIELEFDDFDFDKTEEERYFIVDNDDSSDIITEPEPIEPIIPNEPDEPIITEPEDEPIITEPEPEPVFPENSPVIDSQTEFKESGWVTNDSEKAAILYSSRMVPKTTMKDVNIWKDIII